jgi:hypothetical protein
MTGITTPALAGKNVRALLISALVICLAAGSFALPVMAAGDNLLPCCFYLSDGSGPYCLGLGQCSLDPGTFPTLPSPFLPMPLPVIPGPFHPVPGPYDDGQASRVAGEEKV